jgi:hypothetical protein
MGKSKKRVKKTKKMHVYQKELVFLQREVKKLDERRRKRDIDAEIRRSQQEALVGQ